MEFVEGEDLLDEIGLERARDLAADDLVEDVDPGVAGAEEEPDLFEVGFGFSVRVREGDSGDVEFEAARVGEPELVEGDRGAGVGSDLCGSDLGDCGCGQKSGGDDEEREESVNGGHCSLSLSL